MSDRDQLEINTEVSTRDVTVAQRAAMEDNS
jgi:hypothetical protein